MIGPYAKLVMKVHEGIITEGSSLYFEGALGGKPGRSRTIEGDGEIGPTAQNETGQDVRSPASGRRFQGYGEIELNARPHEMSTRA